MVGFFVSSANESLRFATQLAWLLDTLDGCSNSKNDAQSDTRKVLKHVASITVMTPETRQHPSSLKPSNQEEEENGVSLKGPKHGTSEPDISDRKRWNNETPSSSSSPESDDAEEDMPGRER